MRYTSRTSNNRFAMRAKSSHLCPRAHSCPRNWRMFSGPATNRCRVLGLCCERNRPTFAYRETSGCSECCHSRLAPPPRDRQYLRKCIRHLSFRSIQSHPQFHERLCRPPFREIYSSYSSPLAVCARGRCLAEGVWPGVQPSEGRRKDRLEFHPVRSFWPRCFADFHYCRNPAC